MSAAVPIGIVTIGQSPRADLLRPLRRSIPAGRVDFVEVGALDGLTAADLPGDPRSSLHGYPLTTRLRDGTIVTVDEAFLLPLVQTAIEEVERRGCVVTVLLCAGGFSEVRAARPLIRPFELAVATLRSLGVPRIAVVVPNPNQLEPARRKWSAAGFTSVVLHARLRDVPEALEIVPGEAFDAVILDYVGHPSAAVERLHGLIERPIIDLGDLTARTLSAMLTNR